MFNLKPAVVNYISAFTGSGKTYNTADHLAVAQTPFIYAVPTLTQVEEVKDAYLEACKRNNTIPNELLVIGDVQERIEVINGTEVSMAVLSQGRINDLIRAINSGVSVICSHNCFIGVEDKDLNGIKNYTVVLDEVHTLIKPIGLSNADYNILVDAKRISVDADGKVNWTGYETDAELEDLMLNKVFPRITRLIKDGRVYKANQFFVEEVPHKVFKEAKTTLVLAYMFEATYMNYHLNALGFQFNDLTNDFYQVARFNEDQLRAMAKSRLVVKTSRKEPMNTTFTGWSKANKNSIASLVKAVESVRKKSGFSYEDAIFTCPKDVVEDETVKFGKATWVYSGARGTEKYADKTCVLFLLDKNHNPAILARVNQIQATKFSRKMSDEFALQEMIQFIWRSAIRNINSTEQVTVYIASHRMHKLFTAWLNK